MGVGFGCEVVVGSGGRGGGSGPPSGCRSGDDEGVADVWVGVRADVCQEPVVVVCLVAGGVEFDGDGAAFGEHGLELFGGVGSSARFGFGGVDAKDADALGCAVDADVEGIAVNDVVDGRFECCCACSGLRSISR